MEYLPVSLSFILEDNISILWPQFGQSTHFFTQCLSGFPESLPLYSKTKQTPQVIHVMEQDFLLQVFSYFSLTIQIKAEQASSIQ